MVNSINAVKNKIKNENKLLVEHDTGVGLDLLHRDIKPGNIVKVRRGGDMKGPSLSARWQ